jgi:DNA-binding NarL/FixJ family response regulator
LITALRTVSQGKKYISSSLAQILASSVGTSYEKHPHKILSDREYQVMQMICSGKNTTEIAKELSISVKTVSTYRTRTLKKMNLKNDVELTHYAIQKHLLD